MPRLFPQRQIDEPFLIDDANLVSVEVGAIKDSRGAIDGIATLDASRKVPFTQLPVGATNSTVAQGDHSHTTLAHTHSEYLATTTRGAAGGVAELDAAALLPAARLPAHSHTTADVSISPLNTQTAAYTLVLADAGKVVELNVGTAVTLTIPANAAAAFAIGTTVVIRQLGAGQVTVAVASGVTLRSRGTATKLAGQYADASLHKHATDEWVLTGDITV